MSRRYLALFLGLALFLLLGNPADAASRVILAEMFTNTG
jgi:hypothetical protein